MKSSLYTNKEVGRSSMLTDPLLSSFIGKLMSASGESGNKAMSISGESEARAMAVSTALITSLILEPHTHTHTHTPTHKHTRYLSSFK